MDAAAPTECRLKARRKALDLTQEALARRVHCSATTIKKIEAGTLRPSRQLAGLIADVLEVSALDQPAFVGRLRSVGQAVGSAPSSEAELPGPAVAAAKETPAGSFPTSSARWAMGYNPLPLPLTALLGRIDEVAALTALLDRDGIRLLTLTGPGGVGKTRLALQVAQTLQARGRYAAGVLFVELAALRDAEFVLPTVARLLGIPEIPTQPARERLIAALRHRQLLLLLDNCEHLPAMAPSLTEILARCPRLAILATSRAALRVRGEQVFPVTPLILPELQPLPSLAVLAQTAAVALFVQRARAVAPSFTLDEGNADAVAAVCTRLDGLPLAIELAVARAAVLSPQALLARLDHRLGLLVDGPRDLPARQRTLRETLTWSYDLLQDGQRALFRRLGVFVGQISLDAVEQVCLLGDEPKGEALAQVCGLVETSLLSAKPGGEEPRFTMLETVREYALEQLAASGEREAIQARHAGYYAALAEEAEPHLRHFDQDLWVARLEEQHDNLRAALRWALDYDADTGTRIVGAVWWCWYIRGYVNEGRAWLERMVARSLGMSTPARAKALLGAGVLAWRQRDYIRATECFVDGEVLARTLDLPHERALALNVLGAVSRDPDRSRLLLGQSLELSRAAGDTWCTALSIYLLGCLAAGAGDLAGSEALFTETLALSRQLGDTWSLLSTLSSLGLTAQAMGDNLRAGAVLTESLSLSRELGYAAVTADLLRSLARVVQAQGDDDAAVAQFFESAAIFGQLGDGVGRADALINLGWIAHGNGNVEGAYALFTESMDLLSDQGEGTHTAVCLEGLAAVALARGRAIVAARLLGAAQALADPATSTLAGLGVTPFGPIRPTDIVAAVRAQLDEAAYEAAFATGKMQPESSVTLLPALGAPAEEYIRPTSPTRVRKSRDRMKGAS